MLSVVILCVIILSVVAPLIHLTKQWLSFLHTASIKQSINYTPIGVNSINLFYFATDIAVK